MKRHDFVRTSEGWIARLQEQLNGHWHGEFLRDLSVDHKIEQSWLDARQLDVLPVVRFSNRSSGRGPEVHETIALLDGALHRVRISVLGGGWPYTLRCLDCRREFEVGPWILQAAGSEVTDAPNHPFDQAALDDDHTTLTHYRRCIMSDDSGHNDETTQTTDETRPDGIVEAMPEDNYHADPGIGSSVLRRQYTKSHRHATHPVEVNDAMRLGSWAHMAILEPQRWADVRDLQAPHPDLYYRHDTAARMLADGADEADIIDAIDVKADTARGYLDLSDVRSQAAFYDEHGTDIDTPDDDTIEQVEGIRDAVLEFMDAGDHDLLLDRGTPELSIFWDDAETGRRCKGRIDSVARTGDDRSIVVDLKITGRDVRKHGFERMIGRRAYHIQAGHYARGLEACGAAVDRWLWLAVEKSAPYGVKLYQLADADLAAARDSAAATLRAFDAAERSDDYDGYSTTIETIHVPDWA